MVVKTHIVYFHITAVFTFFLFTGCDPFDTQFDEKKENVVYYESNDLTNINQISDTILVMTWNIKFGGGRIDFFWDCYGDRSLMEEDEVYQNLEGIADKINKTDPDILLIQEIDILSKRTCYIDQVQWLLDNTNFNYAAYASGWKADYIPSDGIGRINSGNAIFSKWKIEDAKRIALPLITNQPAHEKYFYLKRCMIKSKILHPSTNFYALNIHASALNTDSIRKEHIHLYKDELDLLNNEGSIFVSGGDLNSAPPGTVQLKDFDDYKDCDDDSFEKDDYTNQTYWVQSLYDNYTPCIDLEIYKMDNKPYLTFTSDKDGFWNRKIDYLFTNAIKISGSEITHQDENSGGVNTMNLSDHAPVSFKVIIY